jgi:hypothetical protein
MMTVMIIVLPIFMIVLVRVMVMKLWIHIGMIRMQMDLELGTPRISARMTLMQDGLQMVTTVMIIAIPIFMIVLMCVMAVQWSRMEFVSQGQLLFQYMIRILITEAW